MMGILQRTVGCMMRAVCVVERTDRKRAKDFILMLCLKEAIDQLTTANSVRWHGNVLRREDGHVLRRALDFEVEG